jgi:RNA polymerase subunit RPABC4/transcription elongation factor Spt4
MAFCSNCGTKLDDGAKFCPSCGTPAGGVASVAPKPVSEKVGNIRKCPACGAEVPAMAAVCSECGHEFSGVQASNTVHAFFEKLDTINQTIYEKEVNQEAKEPLGGALGAMMGLDRMTKTFKGTSAGVKRQIAMIEGYPIPNSKEDIIEFIVLASSRFKGIKKPLPLLSSAINVDANDEFKLDDAWRTKCEQAYTKAKISFGSDKDAIAQIESILKEKKIIK